MTLNQGKSLKEEKSGIEAGQTGKEDGNRGLSPIVLKYLGKASLKYLILVFGMPLFFQLEIA